jgi:hypothetical protein
VNRRRVVDDAAMWSKNARTRELVRRPGGTVAIVVIAWRWQTS